MLYLASCFAFIVTVLFMIVLRPIAHDLGFVDVPGGRKRHGYEVPLVGGLSMSLGVGLALLFLPPSEFLVPTICAIYLLVFVGLIDDRYDLPAGVRLVVQAMAATMVVFGAGLQVSSLDQAFFVPVELGPFSALFSLLLIISLINAFNVIDGIDGLAGGLSLISLLSLALVGIGCDAFGLAVVSAAAIAGFLLFNLPLGVNSGVRSFMGDAGSTFLGLTIAVIGISLSQSATCDFAPVIGLWFVAVPVYDLFSAFIRRLAQGRSPFAPDHEHLHHALMANGLSARSSLIFLLCCSVLFSAIGLVAHYVNASEGVMLISWYGGLILYYQALRRPARIVRFLRSLKNLPKYRVIRS